MTTYSKLIEELKNQEYRRAFVFERIDTGIPFQIHALREKREWSQEELAERVGMAQESISRLEDPNYGKFTLTTLKRLAVAFDIGLIVEFVSFGELVDRELNLRPDSVSPDYYEKDPYFKQSTTEVPIKASVLKELLVSGKLADMTKYQKRKEEQAEMENMLRPGQRVFRNQEEAVAQGA